MRAQSLGYVAAVALVVAAGLGLRWQVLEQGLITDDYVAAAILDGSYPGGRGPLDLFNFIDGTPADLQRHLDAGTFPWWSAPDLRLSMMRPLAALLVHADLALFGDRVALHHAHSLAWWVLLMLAAALLLRSVLPAGTAAFALLIFALEEGHNLPVTWLANRSALAALAFGVLGVWLHLIGRRDGVRWAVPASAASFAVALGFGEWGFPVLGYVVAYEWLRTDQPAARRLRALLPAALLGLGFVALRAWLGYGVRGSGIYLDPVDEPAQFLGAAGERIPIFFGDLFFGISAEWWVLGSPWRDSLLRLGLFTPEQWLKLPGWQFWHVAIGVGAMLTSATLLQWGLCRRPAAERGALSWLLLGGFLSLLPMVASFPTSRLVLPAALAVAAALAGLCRELGGRVLAPSRHVPLATLGSATLLAAVGYVQLYRPIPEARTYIGTLGHLYDSAREWVLHAELDPRTLAEADVVVLAVAEQPSGFWAPLIRRYHGLPTPRSWRTLSAAPHAHDLARPADNVLELTALGGGFAAGELEKLYRTPRAPLPLGHTVRMAGMTVQVVEVVAGEARRIRVTFDRSLDDPGLVFLASTPVGLSRAPIPEVGGVRRLPRAHVPNRFALELDRRYRDPFVRCPGARPALDQCRNGFAFSDCDGRDAPAWACSYAGDCRWFVGGCVAAGYEPSTCPADQLGCQHGQPFDRRELLGVPWVRDANDRTLAAWGRQAFRPERAFALPVALDAQLVPRDAPLLRCAGPGPAGGPCWAAGLRVARPLEQAGILGVQLEASGPARWALSVEAYRQRDGQLRARVCRVAQQSGVLPGHAAPRAVDCATSGELRLNRAPQHAAVAAPALHVIARFADGGLVDAEL
jgi:hypothetical protein